MAKKPAKKTSTSATLTITRHFVIERETPGAVRYAEINDEGQPVKGDDAMIGTLYLRKAALGGDIPTALTITLVAAG